ncbi:E3 ubiquitin protein ligase DRIP2-like isoform X1 [Salvia splendens]|uniref:E3 ubiquitin protein ligase DRIP2-like isoform X1 n=1 Tax=Salvia splendens TaxID=180675 RepID=UPI001C2786AA|nr:E3 ubiquitin protein ligase DRIP2-like isoform X1 [Salvia splendens]
MCFCAPSMLGLYPNAFLGTLFPHSSSMDGSIPVSFIQKYLKRKLDLTNDVEVDIKCMGQTIIPTLTLNNLVDLWLKTASIDRVKATIGSSARDFVMVLGYARRAPDS